MGKLRELTLAISRLDYKISRLLSLPGLEKFDLALDELEDFYVERARLTSELVNTKEIKL